MPASLKLVSTILAANAVTAFPIYSIWPNSPALGHFIIEIADLDGRTHVPVKASYGSLYASTNDKVAARIAPISEYNTDIPAIFYSDAVDPDVESNIFLRSEWNPRHLIYIADDGSLSYHAQKHEDTAQPGVNGSAFPAQAKLFKYSPVVNGDAAQQGRLLGKEGNRHIFACKNNGGDREGAWDIKISTDRNKLDGKFSKECKRVEFKTRQVSVLDVDDAKVREQCSAGQLKDTRPAHKDLNDDTDDESSSSGSNVEVDDNGRESDNGGDDEDDDEDDEEDGDDDVNDYGDEDDYDDDAKNEKSGPSFEVDLEVSSNAPIRETGPKDSESSSFSRRPLQVENSDGVKLSCEENPGACTDGGQVAPTRSLPPAFEPPVSQPSLADGNLDL